MEVGSKKSTSWPRGGDARQRFAEQVRGLVGTLGDVHYR